MKIAVDARVVYQEPVLRGIGKTLLALYRRLARLRPDWTFHMYYQVGNGTDPLPALPNVVRRPLEGKGDRFDAWQHVWLPLSVRSSGANVFHSHSGVAPYFPLCRMVATVHDLIPLSLRRGERVAMRWAANVARAARNACRVLTPSEHSRNEIHRLVGIAREKITVVPWGPNEACLEPADIAELHRVAQRYGVDPDRRYVLHFGMADPRKNTRRVLETWAQLPAQLQREYALVVTGVQGPALLEFRNLATQLGISGGAFLHGYAPEHDIALLLKGATALCYPSLSEGFGLPILDAFACGTAVLTSNTTSLPEVAGDAALLVDPHSTEAIATGLARLLSDDTFRCELVSLGRERLKQFSWANCAEQVADVLAASAG
jgi:alpha-1,3-rhamnosyl/mannosyltransferase